MIRFRTTFSDSAGGGIKYNNLYFSATDPADALACKEQVVDFWAGCQVFMHSGVSWALDPLVPVIESTTGDTLNVYDVGAAAGTGTAAGEPLPPSNQVLVRLGTNGIVNNRRVQGKIYIPGLVESINENGRVSTATITALTALLGNAFDGTGDEDLVVWSRPVDGGRPGSIHPVQTTSVWNQFAVLRSRRD